MSDKMLQPSWPIRTLAWAWVRLRQIDEQKYREAGWKHYAEKLHFKFLKLCSSRKHFETAEEIRLTRISARNFNEFRKAQSVNLRSAPGRPLTFKHSGSGGDIIYALPTIKALSQGQPVKLFLNPHQRKANDPHPFNLKMCGQLIPLLEHQPWLSSVQIYAGETVDYDLDQFRQLPSIQTGRNSIAHWYFWLYAVSADLSQPWLVIQPPPAPRGKIVLARSGRCQNLDITYAFLQEFGEIDFVGTPAEYQEMKRQLPQLQYIECQNLLQLATVIKSARFFIGNQSFPYAVAEALKVPRILEVFPKMPDVIPTGPHTGEAFFQSNFEILVKKFWAQTSPEAGAAGRTACVSASA